MMDFDLKRVVEAMLLSSNEPLSLDKLREMFDECEQPSLNELKDAIGSLQLEYALFSFELIQVATGYVIQTKQQYSHWVARLHSEKPAKYSRALLETLAIIAYKQPVTRGEMEEIRGVTVNSQIIKTLLEREWIRVAGHKDVPGKPAVYTTTKEFLNYFNLRHLNELPSLKPIEECVIQ